MFEDVLQMCHVRLVLADTRRAYRQLTVRWYRRLAERDKMLYDVTCVWHGARPIIKY